MKEENVTISAVIPTRARPKELARLLASLRQQTFRLQEVIVVDASGGSDTGELERLFGDLPLKVLRSSPSVCRQRNLGIRNAVSEFIFLCDDDMEVPPDYLAAIAGFLRENPDSPVVSGMISEKGPDGSFHDMPPISARRLVWNYFFMLGIWCDLRHVRSGGPFGWVASWVRKQFHRRGNTESPAGWPIVGSIREPRFETRFFGLGASVIRRELLLQNPFDESLGESGIGDNYDLALRLAPAGSITVLTGTRCYHHRAPSGRLSPSEVYLQRILALGHFRRIADSGMWKRRVALFWSLCGNMLAFALHGNAEFVRATGKAMMSIWIKRRDAAGGWAGHVLEQQENT